MSRAFANQNSKLSSSDLTKREAFRNKYMMINNRPGLLLHTSSIDNKRINYSDYNYIIGQQNILHCLSGNCTNGETIKNTDGEIYLGNVITLSGDILTNSNLCDSYNSPLNFFIKQAQYTLDNKKLLDYNKSGFANFDICFGITGIASKIDTVQLIDFTLNFNRFSNYFPPNKIHIDLSGYYIADNYLSSNIPLSPTDISFTTTLHYDYIEFKFTQLQTINHIFFTLSYYSPLCLSGSQDISISFVEDIPFDVDSLANLKRLIVLDYSSNLISLDKLGGSLKGLYNTRMNLGGAEYNLDKRKLFIDNSFNTSTTLPGLKIDTLTGSYITLAFMLADSSINQDISAWDVSAVNSMEGMFQDASCGNIGEINRWHVKSVTDMSGMFRRSNFKGYIGDWSVNDVSNMAYMFMHSQFDTSINKWDVSNVKDMQYMFAHTPFNKPLNDWSVNNVNNMAGMFMHSSFNQDISSWDVSSVTDMSGMFMDSSFNQDISSWSIYNTFTSGNFHNIFTDSQLVTSLDDNNNYIWNGWFDTLYKKIFYKQANIITDLSKTGLKSATMHPNSLGQLYVLIVEDYSSNLINLSDLSNLDNLYSNYSLYSPYSSIAEISFNNSNTLPELQIGTLSREYISLNYMLKDSSLNQDISAWDVSAVKSMEGMFQDASCGKIGDINRWNVKSVTDMSGMFSRSNFKGYIGDWSVNDVSNMAYMFMHSQFDTSINKWHVETVTEMQYMFAHTPFNKPLNDWSVNHVTNMASMFMDSSFNQDISSWDVSSVINMAEMFMDSSFNNNNIIISDTSIVAIDKWGTTMKDLSKSDISVNNMFNSSQIDLSNTVNNVNNFYAPPLWYYKFSDACSNDLNALGGKNKNLYVGRNKNIYKKLSISFEDILVYGVKNFEGWFAGSDFDQSLNNWHNQIDSSDINMSYMFADSSFNQPINDWSVNNVINMKGMFAGSDFNQPLNNWDVSRVTDMCGMFMHTPFDKSLNNWEVGKVINMEKMFMRSDFNQDISNWNVGDVSNMFMMFMNTPFDQSLNHWDVGKVTNMGGMFADSSFNQPINDWSVNNVTNMREMFINTPFDQSLNQWDVGKVTDMSGMFMNTPFDQSLNKWDVGKVKNMSYMFADSNFNQDISSWDVSNLTFATGMFMDSSFNQNIGNWNIVNLFNDGCYNNMFIGSTLEYYKNNSQFLTLPQQLEMINNDFIYIDWLNKLHSANDLSNSQIIHDLSLTGLKQPIQFDLSFNKRLLYRLIIEDFCSNLIKLTNFTNLNSLYAIGDQNVNFDASFNNSTTLPGLKIGTLSGDEISLDFMLADSALDVSINNWDVSAVTSMQGMFQDASCGGFGSITDWKVNKVTDMSGMFMGSDFNQDISSWDVSNLKIATNMFMNSSFNQNIGGWNVKNLFEKNYSDASYNFKDIFIKSGIFKNNNFNNYNIWNGWFDLLYQIPNIKKYLEHTGLKDPATLEPPWLGPPDQPGTLELASYNEPPWSGPPDQKIGNWKNMFKKI